MGMGGAELSLKSKINFIFFIELQLQLDSSDWNDLYPALNLSYQIKGNKV